MVLPDGEWMLGEMSLDPDGVTAISGIRELEDGERHAALASVERLNRFNGPALIGALAGAWDSLRPVLVIESGPSDVTAFQTSEFRTRASASLSHWLTTFSAFRAQLERTTEATVTAPVSTTRARFDRAYREHPQYRLAWELRNLDQHDPPAGAVLTYRRDTREGALESYIDLDRLFAERAVDGKAGRPWRECAALWPAKGEVPAIGVFSAVMNACQAVLASAVSEAEPVLIEDVASLAALHREALIVDGMPILFHVEQHGAERSTMQQLALDPDSFVATLTVLSTARQLQGMPPLDLNHPVFADALAAIAARESGRSTPPTQD